LKQVSASFKSIFLAGLLWGITLVSFGSVFTLPDESNHVVGEPTIKTLKEGQSLDVFARAYDIGYYEILEANPRVNPLRPRPGMRLVVPSQYILPDAPREGVVINLAELRLYFYPKDRNDVVTQPVGIGRPGWETPVGVTAIQDRREHPSWHAPASIKEDMARRGIIIPDVIPPGPNNPLGNYAMRLNLTGYVIHGTNVPLGAGRRVSAGCIRMDPPDIEYLFKHVEVGTPVYIVNQPFKAGWLGNKLYLEAHRPLVEQRKLYNGEYTAMVKEVIAKAIQGQNVQFDWSAVEKIVKVQSGIPGVIGVKAR
jgi:L,D-transpeptidase ErfK/SrfK